MEKTTSKRTTSFRPRSVSGLNDAQNLPSSDEALLRIAVVCALTGLGKSSIYLLIRQSKFPLPVRTGRTSRWLRSEIHRWVLAQAGSR